jgi:ATP-dependent Clp protease adaptor protein ClpS
MSTATVVKKSVDPSTTSKRGFFCNTILFNCDCHSFDEVENQLMKAIHCTLSKARGFAWEVHKTGSAIVYSGPRERCEAVAGVLEDIHLIVKVSE